MSHARRRIRFTAAAAPIVLATLATLLPAQSAQARVRPDDSAMPGIRIVAVPRRAVEIRLTHAEAVRQLAGAGIRVRSNGNCADRRRPLCTSFETVRQRTISGVIALRRASGCPLVASGGTEIGHAKGRFSHWNGYKIDVMTHDCIDAFITRRYRYTKERGDTARLFKAHGQPHIFAQENDHWDITYLP